MIEIETFDPWDMPECSIEEKSILYYSFPVRVNNRNALVVCFSERIDVTQSPPIVSVSIELFRLSNCCQASLVNSLGECAYHTDTVVLCEKCKQVYPEYTGKHHDFTFWHSSFTEVNDFNPWCDLFALDSLESVVIASEVFTTTVAKMSELNNFTSLEIDEFKLNFV